MTSSDAREREQKNASDRKRLIASLLDYLSNTGVIAELRHERSSDAEGSPLEPVIYLHGQNLSCIRLTGAGSGGCSATGDILRFQYEVYTDPALCRTDMLDFTATTRLKREGGATTPFSGPVADVVWQGNGLARRLNRDGSISRALTKCAGSWNYLEFEIEAVSPGEIHILGPRFTNPGVIAEIYQSGHKEEIQNCIFGYKTLEMIAGHVRAESFEKYETLPIVAPLNATTN